MQNFNKQGLKLVFEMAKTRKGHRHAVFIGGRDGIFVLYRPARLNYRRNSHFRCLIDIIAKWKEGVRRERRAFDGKIEPFGPHRGNTN
jgi:hypothetical protein